jgi:Domain of Unknown Function (DUF928)
MTLHYTPKMSQTQLDSPDEIFTILSHGFEPSSNRSHKSIWRNGVTVILLGLSLGLGTLPLFTQDVLAQNKIRYNPRTNVGAPKVSVPGITRSGGCLEANCLTAILPNLSPSRGQTIGSSEEVPPLVLTTLERPTLYFFVPKGEGRAYFRLFEIDAKSGKTERIYRSAFSTKHEAGVIGYQIPDDAPALKVGKDYLWEFTISDLNTLESTRGTMRRVTVTPALARQLNTRDASAKANAYAQAGIWLDTLQVLANDGNSELPAAPSAAWSQLLTSVNLGKVANQPLQPCCQMPQ